MIDLSQFAGPMGGLLCLSFGMGWAANGKVMQKSLDKTRAELKAERDARKTAEAEYKQKLIDDINRLREFTSNV